MNNKKGIVFIIRKHIANTDGHKAAKISIRLCRQHFNVMGIQTYPTTNVEKEINEIDRTCKQDMLLWAGDRNDCYYVGC